MKNQFIYANGLNISQSRKVFQFYFGDFFFKAEKNDKKLRFDIYILKKIAGEKGETLLLEDFVDLDYFNQFWNKGNENNPPYNVMVVDI